MMDNETLHVILGQFVELKRDIIAVSSGQGKIENNISAMNDIENKIHNSMCAVKNDISAMETKINTGQGELKQEILDIKEELKNNICAIGSSQSGFEDRMTCMLDTQLKSVMTWIEQQAQGLREDFKKEVQATRQGIEAIRRDFETQLAAVDTGVRSTGKEKLGVTRVT